MTSSTLELQKRPTQPSWRDKLGKIAPLAISASILGLNLAINAPALVVGAAGFSLASQVIKKIIKSSPTLQKLIKRSGIKVKPWQILSMGFGVGMWLSFAPPSHALFFGAAEQFFNASFPQAAAALPLVFAVLRAIFLLYVAVALIRVVNAVRNDEDWQTMARTPLMVAVCIAVGEVLTNLIIA